MKTKFFLLFVVAIVITGSCATVYYAAELKNRTANHKTIAFIPFEAVLQYKKLPKNMTVAQVKEFEEDMGNVFQEQMYTRFLKKINDYNIEIQDIALTNTLLRQHNVTCSNMNDYTKDQLAQLLGVDAIVSGKIVTSQPMTTGAAIALGIFTGYTGATNKADVNVSLHDGTDSKLLFKYDHTYSGGIGSSPESLTKAMMKAISRKFPYRKQIGGALQ